MNEPSPRSLQVSGIAAAVFIAGSSFVVLLARDRKYVADVSWLTVILLLIPLIPIHELFHASLFPGGLMSQRVTIGFHPKVLGFYAHYDGMMSRGRYVLIAAGPFLLLTVIPLTVVTIFLVRCAYLAEIILANGLLSAVDILTIILVIRQIPRHSLLINKGMKTYWMQAADNPSESDMGRHP